MNVAGRLALWLAAVLAAWSAAAAVAALRTARADIARHAARGFFAASAAAITAGGVLLAALVMHDFRVRFVAARASILMPLRYLPAAILGAPAGALLVLAAATGLLTVLALRRVRDARERTWVVAAAAGLMAVSLVIAGAGGPFAPTFGYRPDGSVLSPDLQRGTAVVLGLSLLGGTAGSAVAFVMTIAALATGHLTDRWGEQTRRWNAVAWSLFFAGAVAGARWHALNPLRGPWLAAPATALWLLPCAIGAWLIHLDAARPATADRTVTRLLLTTATFVTASGALSLGGGAFIRGIADTTERAVAGGRWFGVAPVAALLLTVAIVRATRGALRGGVLAGDGGLPRARVAGSVAHIGFAFVVVAAAGAHFARDHTIRLADTAIFRARDPLGRQWAFTSEGASTLQREDYAAVTYALRPDRDGVRGNVVRADARSYGLVDQDSTGVPAFTAGVIRDFLVETRVSVADPSLTPAAIRISFVPFGAWLVPGAVLVVLGTLLPLAGVHSRSEPVATA